MLLLLLVGFFVLEPLGIPVSAIATVGALILFAVAKRGHAINTGKVLRGAPWQIVIFSLGMYLVVYGLRNAGLTEYLSGVLNSGRTRTVGHHAGNRVHHRVSLIHNEQYAHGADWRALHRGQYGDRID